MLNGGDAPGVDVVVVNYRTPDDLTRFVNAFAEVQWEVPSSLHICNVDPAAEDIEACEAIARSQVIEVPYTYSQTNGNIGYAKTCNLVAKSLGERKAARATIAFFNADTVLKPGVLDACHWELQNNPKVAVVGPKQVDTQSRITHAGIFGTEAAPQLRGWKQKDAGQFDEFRTDAVSVSGSAYFVKRLAWDELTACTTYQQATTALMEAEAHGAFLPTQHYYEETFCSYHARAHGWQVAYHGGVSMIHEWHRASEVGGEMDKQMPVARAAFRMMCDAHQIPHD